MRKCDMDKNKINELLNNLTDIKSLAKNYSQNDLKSEQNMKELIEKVAKAADVKLTNERLNQVKDKISKLKLF
jgi:hypothetical protein